MNERFFSLSNSPISEGSDFTRLLSTPRFQFILLLFLSLFLCTIKLDDGGLMAYDECYYAQKAKEMVRSGDWLTQRYTGKPCHMNPWLHMWSIAAGYRLFGINEWAARFPTAVQTVCIILLTFLFVQWITKRPWTALLASSVLLFIDFFFKYAKKAHMDHLVTLLFMIAVIAFIAGWKRDQRAFLVMGLAVALSMLTKSLLGLMPLVVVFVFVVLSREWGVLKRPLFWISVVLGCAVGSSWYIYEYAHFGEAFVREHFGWQLFSRTFIDHANGSGLSAGSFILQRLQNVYSFIKDAHVWFVLALLGIILSWVPRGGESDDSRPDRRLRLLLVLWIAVPLVLISFSSTFKGWYLMPVYVPLAVWSAFFFSRILGGAERLKIAAYTVLSLLLLYLAVLVVTPLFTFDLKYEIRHPGIRRLATKIRMLAPGEINRVMYFPASPEIAARNGLEVDLSGYWGFAVPWNFYSDHPMDARSVKATLEEIRLHLRDENTVCFTTAEGYRVISADRALPVEVIGRAVDRSMEYVVCCGRDAYERWITAAETDYSRPPLYSLRDF